MGNWLAICGLDVEEYVILLMNGGAADGLEVWIASIALGQPLNIIFDNSVWAIAHDGFDYSYTSLLLTSHCTAVLCEYVPDKDQQEEDLSHLGVAAPPAAGTSGSTQRKITRKGHPTMSIQEYLRRPDSSHSDTDPNKFIEAGEVSYLPIMNAIPCVCPVCSVDLPLGIALYCHL